MKFQYHNPRDRDEHNDCVVRAIAKAYDFSYFMAHKLVQRSTDRQPFSGTSMYLAIADFPHTEIDPYELRSLDNQMKCGRSRVIGSNQLLPTFGAIAPLLDRGRFIVSVKGHVFAVIDGVQYDLAPNGPRKRVRAIYEVL